MKHHILTGVAAALFGVLITTSAPVSAAPSAACTPYNVGQVVVLIEGSYENTYQCNSNCVWVLIDQRFTGCSMGRLYETWFCNEP